MMDLKIILLFCALAVLCHGVVTTSAEIYFSVYRNKIKKENEKLKKLLAIERGEIKSCFTKPIKITKTKLI